MKHLGKLSHSDPFYGFLKEQVLPQIERDLVHPEFDVYVLKGSNQVFLYTEEKSGLSVVGKFFYGIVERPWDVSVKYLKREWEGLKVLRGLGFTEAPYIVPKPYAYSPDINCVVVEEYCPGTPLSEILRAGVKGNHDRLFRRLTMLAAFFAKLHNQTVKFDQPVRFRAEHEYGATLIKTLRHKELIDQELATALYQAIDAWVAKKEMYEDSSVLVHGDATPANFLFKGHSAVIAIDLERVHYSDRLFDIGRIAAEIKHAFLLEDEDASKSEPFVGHLLWQYATHFPDCLKAFEAMTKRLPFYLGTTLLRIARNSWVSHHHRKKLIEQAFLNFYYSGG